MPVVHKISDETMKHLKKDGPKLYSEDLTLNKGGLAKQFGISRTTLWRLEQEDEEFKQAIAEAKKARDDARNEQVEDKYVRRLIDGTASGLEYIFYLCNRLPDRWKDKRAVINNQIIQGLKVDNSVKGLREDEIDVILNEYRGRVIEEEKGKTG